MWPLVHLAGSGEFVVRLPSAIAVAVAAGAVAAIGRRLISPWAGLAAGLLFAVLPAVSRYAQEARSYAVVTALATIASYLLLRTLQAAPGERRRWIVGYGVSLAANSAGSRALILSPLIALSLSTSNWAAFLLTLARSNSAAISASVKDSRSSPGDQPSNAR